VQQREDAQQRLVRVGIAAGPASEQLTLLIQEKCPAGEPPRLAGCQAAGGVGEDDLAPASEAEELPQHSQPPLAAAGQGAEERLDVAHVDQCPVLLAPLAGEEQRQVAHGRQGRLDGVVRPRPGAGPQGALAGREHRAGELVHGRAQRPGNGVDAPLPPPGGQLLGVVGGQGEAVLGEEGLQAAGQRPHRPALTAGAIEQGLRVDGSIVIAKQPAQGGD